MFWLSFAQSVSPHKLNRDSNSCKPFVTRLFFCRPFCRRKIRNWLQAIDFDFFSKLSRMMDYLLLWHCLGDIAHGKIFDTGRSEGKLQHIVQDSKNKWQIRRNRRSYICINKRRVINRFEDTSRGQSRQLFDSVRRNERKVTRQPRRNYGRAQCVVT